LVQPSDLAEEVLRPVKRHKRQANGVGEMLVRTVGMFQNRLIGYFIASHNVGQNSYRDPMQGILWNGIKSMRVLKFRIELKQVKLLQRRALAHMNPPVIGCGV